MTYFERYVKIMPTTNKKNYPLSKLAFNYDGGKYTLSNFRGTFNDMTANECIERFSNSLYKYTDKFIQTDNVIIIDEKCNRFMSNVQPDPFNCFEYNTMNMHKHKTKYENTDKLEFYVGLYTFNELTKKYEYLHKSFYDKKKQMYYLYKK